MLPGILCILLGSPTYPLQVDCISVARSQQIPSKRYLHQQQKFSVLLPNQSYQGLTPLACYRLQREQIRSLGSSARDCGPAELHFSITDSELLTNTTRELNRLREDKAKLEMQLDELQKVVAGLLDSCGGETWGRWGESCKR